MALARMTLVSRDRYGVSAYQLAKTRGYNGILRLFAKSKLILQVGLVLVVVFLHHLCQFST